MAKFRPGDIIFWSIDRTAGEAMVVINYDAKDADISIVAVGGGIFRDGCANCFPTCQNERPLGESARRHYMKLHPGRRK